MSVMPRKSRYNQEIQEIICEAIATEVGDEVGWKAGGIGKTTFYKWIEDKPEFRNAVARAKDEFRKRCPKYQKGLALQKLTEALEHGQPIKWTTKKTRRLDHYIPGKNGQRQEKWHQEETIIEEHTEHRPTPKWAIERVIPRPIEDDINVAIAFLERHGFKVIVEDEEIVREWLDSQNGHKVTKELPGSVE